MKGYIVLADGRCFTGKGFGFEGISEGEVVFNTSMTGYQEVLTDPSYVDQIVTMTYPMMGNYGITEEDMESDRPYVQGFVVKEYVDIPSNFRSQETLSQFLKKHGIPGVHGIDTRALVRHIREKGALPGIIATGEHNIDDLRKRAAAVAPMEGKDLVAKVTCQKPYTWDQGIWKLGEGFIPPSKSPNRYRLAVYDFGIKYNMLRLLTHYGFDLTVLPAFTPAEEILQGNYDGVFLSNGPGDPAAVTYAHANIARLIGKLPLFGICLGHQLTCTALGAKTFKLKFGHRGSNQPVKDLATDKIEITCQNHGFAVDPTNLPPKVRVSHLNLNDNTVEGITHEEYPLFTVQYHPEASAGPHDSEYLFKRFADMIENHRKTRAIAN
ncbi:glutamine-hydrolyzing carbamoyl-phosphate synthase small subunit [Desulfurispirillum indicum]|uniref:Carbamoyl phosphate synthase small chain n=1 Tax=Desulfurispirillum indicum (strain ATCC BAA-1389 / DSM 22839 / S5) TaxID=653733 RepID=E6W2U6_DESIS|nr:glutamine-hydrolyzing carbamoyl-phosphate synthase small subunit [Desulfurispirillum indicum]ADU66771.1 carbamoyl-phosphate synthase, small subunit [Desulfurispirillum indicum S5]UCZ56092.1 glutamine-hydrolyzing carbamoyl-phosphate synthase small subunit [Desulfurispirillum indicum]